MIRFFFLIVGSLSLVLGVVGVFLPLLPTTPFLLLTAFCYARGSQRFYDWFIQTGIYKKHLESFVQKRSMTLQTKLTILLTASTMLLFPLIIIDNLHVRILIAFLYFFKYFYFFTYIKTEENNGQ